MHKARRRISKWGRGSCYEIEMRSFLLFSGLALAVSVGAAIGLSTRARADGPSAPKNLQILPKTMTKDQIKVVMKHFAKDLGVECDYCHDVPDMASDKLQPKLIARQMMKMTEEIDTKWLDGKNGPKAMVTCNTCHRGEAKPKKD
jgi:Photosynthetic reaction centre cytochrome C subunit